MFAMHISQEQRLEKAVSKLLSEPRLTALCGVMMIGKKEVCDRTPTASTNGRDEKYGREFIDKQTDAQLRAVVMHEVGHKMDRDVQTWYELWCKDPKRTNQAADYKVNLWIKDEIDAGVDAQFWTDPPPLLDERFRGMNLLQIFNALEDQSGGDGMEDHDWEDAQQMSDEELEQLTQDIDTALRQGQIIASKTGNAHDLVEQLIRSKVDWQHAMREFITDQCAGSDYTSWAGVNRRFIGSDIIMPASFSDAAGDVIVAIDTSGSTTGPVLGQFLGHLQAVCEQIKPRSVRILYWDTAVRRDEYYSDDAYGALAQTTKPAGGGGTDAACIPQYIAEHGYNPKAVLVLTDGYVSSWGTWSHPLMWCVVGSNRQPPVGKVVYVE